jgi:hypothetical protein
MLGSGSHAHVPLPSHAATAGVLGVLSHLTELLASLKPVTGTAERSLPPHLITYLTSAAMHLYSCLLRSPDAGDPVETAGMMLAGGMLYPAPGSLLPEWAICTARLLLSVNGAASKSWTSDQTSGLRIWQLLYQHKVGGSMVVDCASPPVHVWSG